MTAKKRKNEEFVKANLLPKRKEKRGTISNCSKGEWIIYLKN